MLKLGMEFFYAHGAKGYEAVADCGIPIFLDMKLHDIPNTVAQGLTSLLKLTPPPAITMKPDCPTRCAAAKFIN